MTTILFFVTEDWYFWSHRLPLARAAKVKGYKIYVATRVTEHEERIMNEGFELLPIQLRRRSRNPFLEIKAIHELILLFKKIQPDIVHNVALKPILYGTLASRLANCKVIINAFAGLGFTFIKGGKKGSLVRKVLLNIFRFLFASGKCRIIFQNSEDRKLFVKHRVISSERAILIRGSGVDVKYFRPLDHNVLNNSDLKVIIVSRMLWDKGVGEFVEAAEILKSRKVEATFLLAGAPDPENPASIPIEKLENWQENGSVEWIGHVENIAGLLQKCNIAVLPSYREGLPKSLLEAASAGLPLVATDVPGCREIVRHGVNGLLVPAQDATALADAIETLLKNKKLRERYGRAGRDIVKTEFAQEIVIEQTLTLYKELTG